MGISYFDVSNKSFIFYFFSNFLFFWVLSLSIPVEDVNARQKQCAFYWLSIRMLFH